MLLVNDVVLITKTRKQVDDELKFGERLLSKMGCNLVDYRQNTSCKFSGIESREYGLLKIKNNLVLQFEWFRYCGVNIK